MSTSTTRIKLDPKFEEERITRDVFSSTELTDGGVMFKNPTFTNEVTNPVPTMNPDRDLLSFSNGVLELSTGSFTSYSSDGIDLNTGVASKVTRHHILRPYTGRTDTPLFDTILDLQFERPVSQVLCALLGRLFFKIGQYDMWQVMPYICGVGGTGKSMLLKIVERWFARGTVGNLNSKREEVFGMSKLVDKELVMGRDMPAKTSASLSQDIMQSMTSGEEMEIPRMGLPALYVQWSAPLIMASKHMPDYLKTGDNVGWRMVTFRFDNLISNPQDDLEERILAQELPNIICRCLSAYHDLRARVKTTEGGFWKCMPSEVLEWREWRSVLVAGTNNLEASRAV